MVSPLDLAERSRAHSTDGKKCVGDATRLQTRCQTFGVFVLRVARRAGEWEVRDSRSSAKCITLAVQAMHWLLVDAAWHAIDVAPYPPTFTVC
jgi:hypothetical protein